MLEPIASSHNEPLSHLVYETLLEAIVSGQLETGTILSEVSVARQLEVSRTPVHDALLQLSQDGLVERAANRRARVSQFNRDDVFEIFELRKFLEGPATELASGRMDQRQIGPLRATAAALAASQDAVDWLVRWADFDEEFHKVIAESSGNRRLAIDIGRYRLLHRGFNKLSTNVEILQPALKEHLVILDAIEARRGDLAREAMIAHIAHWQRYFVDNFPR